jgi:hypothetical protein
MDPTLTHSNKNQLRRLSSKRGATTIEAILVLTLFLLLWVGVSYMGRLYDGKLKTRADARSCAWRISLSACERIPSECEAKTEEAPDNEGSDKLRSSKEDATSGDDSAKEFDEALDTEIDGLFKKRISASSSREVRGAAHIDQENVTVSSEYSLPCNSKPRTVDETGDEMGNDFMGHFK